ncbi:hypothetical protein [Nostoc sp.]|uniref:hypothetical protein n=1 Tax=Nostoc sp. TaxID=1180 RepID=UPI002FFCFDB5
MKGRCDRMGRILAGDTGWEGGGEMAIAWGEFWLAFVNGKVEEKWRSHGENFGWRSSMGRWRRNGDRMGRILAGDTGWEGGGEMAIAFANDDKVFAKLQK